MSMGQICAVMMAFGVLSRENLIAYVTIYFSKMTTTFSSPHIRSFPPPENSINYFFFLFLFSFSLGESLSIPLTAV